MDWRSEAQWAKHFLCRREDLGSDSQIPGEAGCDSKHLEPQCSSAEMEGRNQRSTKGTSSLHSDKEQETISRKEEDKDQPLRLFSDLHPCSLIHVYLHF